ncbi:hypothetical protein NDU88_004855 [Pleurodeles waltl]|uniref:Uncharacterized protein n=1 Tax=Pleurodeles waltl TaxID=8319 RepID=A0AAV7QG54_PLEWA|nr:hypothetical protein NDU88_004855 [Pleurodeles waltl]
MEARQCVVSELGVVCGERGAPVGQPQDILTCLHYYKQKEQILTAVGDLNAIDFEGNKIYSYQDLSLLTIRYKWGHPFRLRYVWQNETRTIRTLEEAESLPDIDLGQSEPPPVGSDETSQAAPGSRSRSARQWKRKPQKPSEK